MDETEQREPDPAEEPVAPDPLGEDELGVKARFRELLALAPRSIKSASDYIWDEAHGGLKGMNGFIWRWIQITDMVVRGVSSHFTILRASALTYTTFLSAIPLFVVAFAILKGLGYQEAIANRILEQFTAGSEEIVDQTVARIQGFIERAQEYIDSTNAFSLGGLGGLALLLTAISMLATIEQAINSIWSVKKGRSVLRKVTNYVSLIVFAPLLLGVGISLTTIIASSEGGAETEIAGELGGLDAATSATLTLAPATLSLTPAPTPTPAPEGPTHPMEEYINPDPEAEVNPMARFFDADYEHPDSVPAQDGAEPETEEAQSMAERMGITGLVSWVGKLGNATTRRVVGPMLKLIPFLTIWAIFIFVYKFMPNTTVPWYSALIGGIIAGTSWQTAQFGYIFFSSQFGMRNNVIYDSFTWLIVLFVWVYVSWVILLVGAELTAAHMNVVNERRRRRPWDGSPADEETLALRLGVMLARPMLESLERPFHATTIVGAADELGLPPQPIEKMLSLFHRAGVVSRAAGEGGYQLCRSPNELGVVDLMSVVRHGSMDALPGQEGTGLFDDVGANLTASVKGKTMKDLAEMPVEAVRTFSLGAGGSSTTNSESPRK